jgi:hypothetical protein
MNLKVQNLLADNDARMMTAIIDFGAGFVENSTAFDRKFCT